MNARAILEAPTTAELPAVAVHNWDWRADLASIDAKLAHVATGESWDWRSELVAIETKMNNLAEKFGL